MRTIILFTVLGLGAQADYYVPHYKHLDVDECAAWHNQYIFGTCAKFRAECAQDREKKQLHGESDTPESDPACRLMNCEVELAGGNLRHCQWYGGMDLPDPCKSGFH